MDKSERDYLKAKMASVRNILFDVTNIFDDYGDEGEEINDSLLNIEEEIQSILSILRTLERKEGES